MTTCTKKFGFIWIIVDLGISFYEFIACVIVRLVFWVLFLCPRTFSDIFFWPKMLPDSKALDCDGCVCITMLNNSVHTFRLVSWKRVLDARKVYLKDYCNWVLKKVLISPQKHQQPAPLTTQWCQSTQSLTNLSKWMILCGMTWRSD